MSGTTVPKNVPRFARPQSFFIVDDDDDDLFSGQQGRNLPTEDTLQAD